MKRVALVLAVAGSLSILAALGALALAAPPLPESGTYDMAGETTVRLAGTAADRAGWSVARAGDVNGDGRQDLVVGAPFSDVNGSDRAGAAYVLFGPATPGEVDFDNLGSAGFRIEGAGAGDWAGWSVARLGDVNGDRRADLAIGAPFADRGADADVGAAYLVFGKADTGTVRLGALGAGGHVIGGAAADDRTGFSLSAVPDANGDLLPELVVGAPTAGSGGTEARGAAFLVSSTAFTGDVDLGSPGFQGFRMNGPARSLAGVGVTGLPDMNGDGRGEIAVGATGLPVGEGRPGGVFVVWGRPTVETLDLGSLGDKGFVVSGGESDSVEPGTDPPENLRTASGWAGRELAALPDVNGDGRVELVIGAPHTSPKQRADAGAAYVVFGKPTSSGVDLSQLGDAGVRIIGAARDDLAGWSVGAAGDFDADGKPDVLVGAPAADALSRDNSGAGYVIFGHSLTGEVDLAGLGARGVRIAGGKPGDRVGQSIAATGDVVGDDAGDIVLGSPGTEDRTGAAILAGPKEAPPEPPAPGEPAPPPPDPGVEEEEEIDGCRAVRNVEVVVDDSGSMDGTDPEKLRAEAIRLLLAKERNAEEVIGAVQFGDGASKIFAPQVIDPFGSENNRPDLDEALSQIRADEGGTNYNAAFEVLVDENPGAGARIFLTDGGHNVGEYREIHRGGPPTFVLGFQIGRNGTDGERLQRIAEETGGRYFANVNRRNLQRAINAIDSRLNCDIDLDFDEEPFVEEGEVEEDDVPLDEDCNSADIVVSWGDDDDEFELTELSLRRGKRTIARIGRRGIRRALARGSADSSVAGASATPRKLRVTGRRGRTFITLRATGLGRGRLHYKIRANKLSGRGRVGTQISQSRRVR